MPAIQMQKRFSFFAPAFSRPPSGSWNILSILSLKDFNNDIAQQDFLNRDQQADLVKQATVLLDKLYAHRFQKQTLYAVNPLERLAALQKRLPLVTRKFHEEMISIFMELRDRHTNYILPQEYRWSAAFLPFLIEEFYDDKFPVAELRNDENRYYMISKICTRVPCIQQSLLEDLINRKLLTEQAGNLVLAPGVVISHWNGMPVNRAVELNADFFAGSNEAARHTRSLQNMTVRLLFNVLPPEEEEGVAVRYYDLNTHGSGELKFEWQVWKSDPPAGVLDSETDGGAELVRQETALGIDSDTELVRRVKRALFQKDIEPNYDPSLMPDVFRWKLLELDGGVKLGYIRIWTFDTNYAAILWEFIRIVQKFPLDTQGMILDVRGNSGGSIPATVLLLQLLSPRLIKPQYFQFASTSLTLELCRRTRAILSKIRQAKQDKWEQWEKDVHSTVEKMWEIWENTIKHALNAGTMYSQPIPLVPVEALQYVQQIDPNLGQHYGNRVLLITDALSYSAAEMFAAGFQDNNIGPILGTDGLTGGGGADIWFHHQLGARLAGGDEGDGDGGVKDLIATMPTKAPEGPTFTVALRQSIRAGAHADNPLEDWGVVPDVIHRMTKDDLLAGNHVLLEQEAPEVLLKSVTNQDIVNAFSAAAKGLFAQEKCAALATAAGVTVTENDDPYGGPEIDQLPNLSPAEKQAIAAELPYINEDIYTAFKLAAGDLGISYHWKWMEKAGAGTYNEMSATSNSRSAPYAGKPIDELNLPSNEKAKIKEKLSVAVASRTAAPAYRNKDIKKAFEQAAGNLVQQDLMIQAQLKVSDLTDAPQMLYRGAGIDQLPNLTDDQKEMVKRELPAQKKILPRMPTNQEVIDVFWRVGKDLKAPASALVNARQAAYIGPDIDQIPALSDTQKKRIKEELQKLIALNPSRRGQP
jgi:hypothetical protein